MECGDTRYPGTLARRQQTFKTPEGSALGFLYLLTARVPKHAPGTLSIFQTSCFRELSKVSKAIPTLLGIQPAWTMAIIP